MTNFKTTAALLAAGLLAATAAQASSPAARARPPVAKVSLIQARTIALHAAPGKLIKSEYEKEGGGWRYSFDIKQKGHFQEIGVDATTGKIIENKSEAKLGRD